VLGRATGGSEREQALKALLDRIETAAAEIKMQEDLDPLVKAARELEVLLACFRAKRE